MKRKRKDQRTGGIHNNLIGQDHTPDLPSKFQIQNWPCDHDTARDTQDKMIETFC